MKYYEIEFLKYNIKYKKILKAKNLNTAQAQALSKNWKILNIKEIQKSNFKRLNDERFILFFKELSLLCEVGLSIQEAIKELSIIHSCQIMKKILDNLILAQSLSQAFENANFGLNHAELALIKMAENTGKINEVFKQIAKIREESIQSKNQLKKALRYPSLVFFSVIGAFLFLMLFVMPNFKDLFESLGANLPFITSLMLEIYDFLNDYGSYCISFLIIFILTMILMYKQSDFFALLCDSWFLKMPLFSRIILYNQNYYFFIIFSLLLKSGISISKAFDLSIMGLENKFLRLKYKEVLTWIDSGLDFGNAFKKINIFDSLVFSMLNIAMKSGKLELLSEEIAKYYKQKSENFMDKFFALIEPIMTLFVALLVLFLALGIFLPMWELSSGVNF